MITLIISILVIILISVIIYLFLHHNKNKKDNFCSCRQMINKVCPNTYNQTMLYETGKLTEYSPLSKNNWVDIMPEDIYNK